jgi:hypothetical protein
MGLEGLVSKHRERGVLCTVDQMPKVVERDK